MADNFKYVQTQPYILAGAGAIIGATSITLKSFNGIDGTPLIMTDFGSIGFGTLEPGNGFNEEQISFTGVTHNLNGTTTLTGVKNVSFVSPYTQTSGLAKTHAGSTSFVISNTSGFYDQLTSKSDDETVTGIWTFTSPNVPRMDVTYAYSGSDGLYFTTKEYVDGVAISGAPDASVFTKGVTKVSVPPVVGTNPIAVGDNDNRVPPIDTSTMTSNQVAALVGTGTPNGTTGKYVTNDDTSSSGGSNKVVRLSGTSYPAADGSAITKTGNLNLIRLAGYTSATNTNENTVFTTTVNGDLMSTTGMIRVRVFYYATGGYASNADIRLKYGGSTLSTLTHVTGAVGGGVVSTYQGCIEGWIINSGATNSQTVTFNSNGSRSAIAGDPNLSTNYVNNPVDTTSAIDTTTNQTLAMTIQKSNANMTVVFYQTVVEIIYK